jgi:hypothetical protein
LGGIPQLKKFLLYSWDRMPLQETPEFLFNVTDCRNKEVARPHCEICDAEVKKRTGGTDLITLLIKKFFNTRKVFI